MTSKECLEHICKSCDHECCPYIHYEKSRCAFYGVIRKDLDRLEKLEKVIDILENKIVNILILKYCIAKGGGVETYNLHYKTEDQITQEEYELLKEVLEND